MTVLLSTLLAALAEATDDGAFACLLRECAVAMLSDPAEIAELAAAAAGVDDDPMTEAGAALLSRALDEARMAAENSVPEGTALIDAVSSAIAEVDAASPIAPGHRLRLAGIYARAGLAPPPFAVLTPDAMAGVEVGEMPDFGAVVDPILREADGEPLQAHAALGELFAGMPVELAAMLVSMTLARPGAMEARLGLYWLLDARSHIRFAAATALRTKAEAGTLPADAGALLPVLRKWLPDDAARAAVDVAIRRRMRDAALPAASQAITIHRAAASLPDGAGAQSLVAAIQQGGRRGVAMAMLKQGHGVKDAFVIPCSSASEQRRMLARVLDEIETLDVPPAVLAGLLARGLGEGLALDLLPAPGIVDLAEIWEPNALVPAPGDTTAILAAIGAEEALKGLPPSHRAALIRSSADWMDRFGQGDSWFEDTGALRAAIARARTEKGREAAVWKHLESRRDWWARHFAVSAATLRSGSDAPLWLSFARVAKALLEGNSLKRIPIMADILALTLEAHEARDMDVPSHARSKANTSPFARTGISEPYLQGYLTALAIAPVAPSAQAWIGSLLGGIEFPGEGSVERLLEFVMLTANRINDEAADPGIVAGWLAPLDAEELRDWTAGFDALLMATRRSWPAKALNADDKRVLRDIALVAKGSDGEALRAVLPAWVGRRHGSRN